MLAKLFYLILLKLVCSQVTLESFTYKHRLSPGRYGHISYYDSVRDVVWLMGGWKQDSVDTWDYKTNTYESKTSILLSSVKELYHWSNNYCVINDIIYFTSLFSNNVSSYNLASGITDTIVNLGSRHSSLACGSTLDILYILLGYSRDFYMYNISSANLYSITSTLYSYTGNPFLYYNDKLCAFSGAGTYNIECINTNELLQFYTIDDTLSEFHEIGYALLLDNGYSLLLGGKNESNCCGSHRVIDIFNFNSERVYRSGVELYSDNRIFSAVFISSLQRIYVIGGHGCFSCITESKVMSYVSDEETNNPTNFPSSNPTQKPFVDNPNICCLPRRNYMNFDCSYTNKLDCRSHRECQWCNYCRRKYECPGLIQPTFYPTDGPSMLPLYNPTYYPTSEPTMEPTQTKCCLTKIVYGYKKECVSLNEGSCRNNRFCKWCNPSNLLCKRGNECQN